MKILRFDSEVGRSILQYNSTGFVISGVVHLFDEAVLNCAYLSAKGTIGYHQAALPQLFLVVHGEGWVRSELADKAVIKVGQAAYWEKGEWHDGDDHRVC
jgi:hypothetical protein